MDEIDWPQLSFLNRYRPTYRDIMILLKAVNITSLHAQETRRRCSR